MVTQTLSPEDSASVRYSVDVNCTGFVETGDVQ